ncbi:alpha/beta-hydrolase, partial [Microthyrium microscopicum]
GGGVKNWMGIPFASPPVRFMPPQDPQPWSTPLETTKESDSCLQQFGYPEASRNLTIKIFSTPMPKESEDCLYLNVWAPAGPAPSQGFPVMFYIYGGNLQFGHGALPQYSGENIARERNVVLVNFNYRTNVFGFPGAPSLKKGENNLGFLDQRKALDWTNKNIKAFGGDPKKVTIFGESAGGFSVKQLVANPPDPLPFRAAIMQSQAASVRGGAESFLKLASALHCNTTMALECVRHADAREIKSIIEHQRIDFGPQEDGITHTVDTRPNYKSGKAAKVPIIIGTNKNEGSAFAHIGLATPNTTLEQFLGAFVPGGKPVAEFVLNEVKPLYPWTRYRSDVALAGAIFTDLGFTCGTNFLATSLRDNGYTVYRYFYTAAFPSQAKFENAGAYHSSEVDAILGTYMPTIHAMDRVSNVIQSIWSGFAKNPS